LDESDADPTNPGNVILVYTGWSVSGTWDAGNTWNREHIWPQSLLGYDSVMSSDLHNLKPSDPTANNSRSNKYFDNVTTSASYEPRDEVKGDVARILLYMLTMYDDLTLVNSTPSVYEMALLNVILGWHEIDPVDDFERNRNNVIAAHQGNRNPYIDYPEFVDLIWD
jgi:endonuclease I